MLLLVVYGRFGRLVALVILRGRGEASKDLERTLPSVGVSDALPEETRE